MPVPAYNHRQGKKRMWLRWGWRIARWMTDAEDQSTAGAHLWNHDHPADLTILAWCLYWCWPHCLSPVCTSAHLTLCLSVTWGPLPTDICSLKSTTCKIARQYCYMVLQQYGTVCKKKMMGNLRNQQSITQFQDTTLPASSKMKLLVVWAVCWTTSVSLKELRDRNGRKGRGKERHTETMWEKDWQTDKISEHVLVCCERQVTERDKLTDSDMWLRNQETDGHRDMITQQMCFHLSVNEAGWKIADEGDGGRGGGGGETVCKKESVLTAGCISLLQS